MLRNILPGLAVLILVFNVLGTLIADELPIPPETDTASKYVSAYSANKQFEIINQINGRPDPPHSLVLPKDSKFVGKSLFTIPKAELSELLQYASEEERKANEEIDRIKASWAGVKAQKMPRDVLLLELNASESAVGLLATLFKSENRWIWIGVFVGLVFMGLATLHDRRHDIRRRLFGTRARSLRLGLLVQIMFGGLGLFSLAIIFFGEFVYEALLPAASMTGQSVSRSDINDEIEAWESENIQLRSVSINLPSPRDSELNLMSEEQRNTRLSLRKLEVKKKLLVDLFERLNADEKGLNRVQEKLVENQGKLAQSTFWNNLIRFGFATIFLCGIALFSRKIKRQIVNRFEYNSNTCPSCLAHGSFSDDISGAAGGIVRCDNLVPDPDYPDEDRECGFELRAIYKSMPKLCIPTLGHVYAGKTHWLAMAYRELSNSQFDRDLSFSRVQGAQTEVFDDLVSDLIDNRQGTGATQVDYVDPLLFHFTDKDKLGQTDSLINMFDYSGEVTLSRTIEDPLRARALDADGYLFFLDPTLPAEPQQKALNSFAEDVKILKGLDGGRTIQVPVAICVSKIDLLCNEPYADPNNPTGGGVIGQFYKEVGELDPNGMDYSLKTIDAFSEMMQRYTSTIWPGWNINQAVDRLFDGRFRYFPLSPVGIQSLGATDLDGVVQVPYRVIHPLLWLLHMNGYKVLN